MVLVYLCIRPNDRLQVWHEGPKSCSVKRYFPKTLGDAPTWGSLRPSRGSGPKYLFSANGQNGPRYIMDRKSLEILTMFGDGGPQPGILVAVQPQRDRFKGQPLYDRKPTRPPQFRSSLQRPRARHQDGTRSPLAIVCEELNTL